MADKLPDEVSLGTSRLIDEAIKIQREFGHEELAVNHLLVMVFQRNGSMAKTMIHDLDVPTKLREVRDLLNNGHTGTALNRLALVRHLQESAISRGRLVASELDYVAVVLGVAGYSLESKTISPGDIRVTGSYSPTTSARATPLLDTFGRDLTAEATAGRFPELIGRERELQLMVETLCRRTKRNPLLVGPAGVGKTAIVEGLARLIADGTGPQSLDGKRVISLQPSSLVAGTGYHGDLEKRIQGILDEASNDEIILFIDEVHAVIGAGGSIGATDIASQIKPALARGNIACIGATTDEEYRKYFERDKALERRFQPILIQEMSREETLQVLNILQAEIAETKGIDVLDATLRWLVDFADQFMRNRNFPDKAVDLFDQVVAQAVSKDEKRVRQADAESVASTMIGMPVTMEDGIVGLRSGLLARRLLSEFDAEALCNRLAVTLRNLDIRNVRPDAVLLLVGETAGLAGQLGETIAESLYGSASRVVDIDFGRFYQPSDITILLGAGPSYVGYNEPVAIHRLIQIPWSVLVCRNVHACHPYATVILEQALSEGFFTDSSGRKIYLSNAVVILTSEETQDPSRPRRLGFLRSEDDTEDGYDKVSPDISRGLLDQVDIVSDSLDEPAEQNSSWITNSLLLPFSMSYSNRGLELEFDESVVQSLIARIEEGENLRSNERYLESELAPKLISLLPKGAESSPVRLQVLHQGTSFIVRRIQNED